MEKSEILLNYILIPENLAPRKIEMLKTFLPFDLRQRMESYKFQNDKLLFLFGKILLFEGLKSLGINSGLASLAYNPFGRPFLLEDKIDFNISHSGKYVCCAFTIDNKVGIDIQKIEPYEINEFNDYMNNFQWQKILNCQDSRRQFFKYWVIKESVIKAIGKGLSIPLKEIHIHDEKATWLDDIWHIGILEGIDSDYCCCIASKKQFTYKVTEMHAEWLLDSINKK